MSEGLEMASDALAIQLAWNVENDLRLPVISEMNQLSSDPTTQFATLISVNLADYLQDKKPDKKTNHPNN